MPFIPVDPALVADCADALRDAGIGGRRTIYDHLSGTPKTKGVTTHEIAETVLRRAAERGRITERGGA